MFYYLYKKFTNFIDYYGKIMYDINYSDDYFIIDL